MFRHGYFTCPEIQVAHLVMRQLRCIRVIVDVGLHTKGMQPEEAVLRPVSAEAEVQRCLGNPTQPSSYLIGWLQIEKLRRDYAAKMGEQYDEREFHDKLLSLGLLPIRLLPRWICASADEAGASTLTPKH